MTQAELASELGVDPITVSRWERDVVEPRATTIRRLAGLAGMPVSWFYEEAAA